MSLYLIAGSDVSTGAVAAGVHLPSGRAPRYPSDMDDVQWAITAPLIPTGGTGRRGGRPPTHSRRDVVDGVRYVAHNSCVWRALPSDFPPWQVVYAYHARWARDGTLNQLHNALRDQVRLAEGRQPQPSAALVDSPIGARRRDRRPLGPRLRWREGSPRAQAAHRHRHHRAAAGRAGHRRLHPGPRRWPVADVGAELLLSPRQPGLGRLRLRRTTRRLGQDQPQPDGDDRAQTRRADRLPGSPP